MRVGPIGLLWWQAPACQASWASGVLSSHITHQAPLCKEACASLGVATAAATAAGAAGTDPVPAVLAALAGRTPYTDYAGMLAAMLAAGPELQPASPIDHGYRLLFCRPSLNSYGHTSQSRGGLQRHFVTAPGPRL